MSWHRVLFAHWPLAPETIRKIIPSSLELDTFDDHAWLGIVPFEMRDVKPRFLPGIPGHTNFLELNVRTYVRYEKYFGVYFFSLDAQSGLAVETARSTFHLPYFRAEMRDTVDTREGVQTVRYVSRRNDRRSRLHAQLDMTYQSTGEMYRSTSGNLDHWLTERYCLFSVHPKRARDVYVGHIHHEPWRLHQAHAEIRINTMTKPLGIDLAQDAVGDPVFHYADPIDVVAWQLTKRPRKDAYDRSDHEPAPRTGQIACASAED